MVLLLELSCDFFKFKTTFAFENVVLNLKKYTFVLIYILLFIVSFSSYSFALEKAAKDHIAVKDFNSGEGVSPVLGKKLANDLRSRLVNSRFYFVKTTAEQELVLRNLKAEEQKAFECGELECAVAFGQQLQVNRLIYGELGRDGRLYKMRLSLIDVNYEVLLKVIDVEGESYPILRARLDDVMNKVNALARVDGKVISINENNITTTFSQYDPVDFGTILDLFRNEGGVLTLIGTARIYNILESQSTASLLGVEEGYSIQVSDILKISKRTIQDADPGKVKISVNTSWVNLILDGKPYSALLMKEDSGIILLKPGMHTFLFSKKGYVSREGHKEIARNISVKNAGAYTIDVNFLKKKSLGARQGSDVFGWLGKDRTATLRIKTDPPDAVVFIDGEEYGVGPNVEVPTGEHEITLRKYLYYDHSLKYKIDAKRVNDLGEIKLEPRFGEVIVLTEPSGAILYVNGEEHSVTPFQIRLKSGIYEIVLRKFNYHDLKTQIKVQDGQLVKQKLDLKPNFGTLSLLSDPKGTIVYLDGKKMGKTPENGDPLVISELKSKKYRLEVQAAHYKSSTYYPLIQDERILKKKVKLRPVYGLLNVTSKPDGATVYVDGKEIGRTPLRQFKLDKGSYEVMVKDVNNYYFPLRTKQKIKIGDKYFVREDLQRKKASLSMKVKIEGVDVSDADVSLDGKRIPQRAPFAMADFDVGHYILRVEKDDYFYEKEIEVKYDSENIFLLHLIPKKSDLHIRSNIKGAAVYINDVLVADYTPFTVPKLEMGTYSIRVEKIVDRRKYVYRHQYKMSPGRNYLVARLFEDLEYKREQQALAKRHQKEIAAKFERFSGVYWNLGYRNSGYSLTLADADYNKDIDLSNYENVQVIRPMEGVVLGISILSWPNEKSNSVRYRFSYGNLYGFKETYSLKDSGQLVENSLSSGHFFAMEGISRMNSIWDGIDFYMGFGVEMYLLEFTSKTLKKSIVKVPFSVGIGFPLVDVEVGTYLTPMAGSIYWKAMLGIYQYDFNKIFK
jgi:hypothetical protein